MKIDLILGNCLEKLEELPENSVDSIVTDPPYGLSFMDKDWDKGVPGVHFWAEMIRVLKPGGYLLSFGGTRTYHRMASAIEDAGFEVRDMIEWVYGSGFPKSLNIGKAVDKLQRGNKTVELIDALLEEGHTLKELGENAGIPSLESSYRDWTTGGHKPEERSWERMLKGLGFSEADGLNIVEKRTVSLGGGNAYTFREGKKRDWEMKITKGTSEWEGWGTALKPAHEPICMARKPLEAKTIAENVLKWGTGGINIDESRVEYKGKEDFDNTLKSNTGNIAGGTFKCSSKNMSKEEVITPSGRFPANLIHDNSEEVRECFPETKTGKAIRSNSGGKTFGGENIKPAMEDLGYDDSGNASRFFKSIIYQAKASKSERNKGCEDMEAKQYSHDGREKEIENPYQRNKSVAKNNHPTVKPIALMEYLIKMVTPKGGTVLDPFMGSGSTGVACQRLGMDFIGIELVPEYFEIANARLKVKEIISSIGK